MTGETDRAADVLEQAADHMRDVVLRHTNVLAQEMAAVLHWLQEAGVGPERRLSGSYYRMAGNISRNVVYAAELETELRTEAAALRGRGTTP